MNKPESPKPSSFHPLKWLHQNLFNNGFNTVLTLLCLWGIYSLLSHLLPWLFHQAQWSVIQTNMRLFLIGRFPKEQIWRIWCGVGLLAGTVSLSLGSLTALTPRIGWTVGGLWLTGVGVNLLELTSEQTSLTAIGGNFLWLTALSLLCSGVLWGSHRLKAKTTRHIAYLPLVWLFVFLLIISLLGGGLGLPDVRRTLWGGLLLTLLMAFAGIGLSFPLGVLLALGRRSPLPVFRVCSILYIEIIRGLPLIGILFSVQVLLPLVLPSSVEIDSVVRAIAGLVVFSSAYLAENVRGGLQALPQGQIEAAQALGLSSVHTLGLIVLPQALRAVIPAIVGQFIGLFKDTSLLSLVGLSELMGMARTILAQSQFIGRYAEVYAVVGLIYFVFCYVMSQGSRMLETQLAASRT